MGIGWIVGGAFTEGEDVESSDFCAGEDECVERTVGIEF